jgi:hypothetical protein
MVPRSRVTAAGRSQAPASASSAAFVEAANRTLAAPDDNISAQDQGLRDVAELAPTSQDAGLSPIQDQIANHLTNSAARWQQNYSRVRPMQTEPNLTEMSQRIGRLRSAATPATSRDMTDLVDLYHRGRDNIVNTTANDAAALPALPDTAPVADAQAQPRSRMRQFFSRSMRRSDNPTG